MQGNNVIGDRSQFIFNFFYVILQRSQVENFSISLKVFRIPEW